MLDGGDLAPNQSTAGLLNGDNVLFNNPFPLLAPGTTGERPVVSPEIYYRLRFNTTLNLYEYYLPTAGDWIQLETTSEETLVQGTNNQVFANGTYGIPQHGLVTLTLPQNIHTGATPTFNNLKLNGGDILDVNGNIILKMMPEISSVNYVTLYNAATLNSPVVEAGGTDANINLFVASKEAGQLLFLSKNTSVPFKLLTGTNWQHVTELSFPNNAATRTVTFQDSSGTLAYLSDVPLSLVDSLQGTEHQVLVNGTFGTPETGVITLTLPQDIDSSSTPTFNSLKFTLGNIVDSNNHVLFAFAPQPSPGFVNYMKVYPSVSGAAPEFRATGSDASVGINLLSKFQGSISLITQAPTTPITIYNGTNEQHSTNLVFSNTSAVRNVVFQDASGTLAFLTDIPSSTVTTAQGTANQILVNATSGTPQSGAITLTLPQDIATTSSPTFNHLILNGGQIVDASSNVMLNLSSVASSVNYINISPAVSGFSPTILASGASANIGIIFQSTGNGIFSFATEESTTPIIFRTGSAFQHVTQLSFSNTAATRTVTFQDASGTVAYLSNIPSLTPAALTKTDDTNVTLTLGGTPATALLQATSLTLGWTGQLGLTRGGTNASLTASNGGILYSTASALSILSGTATANQMLMSGATAAPTWSTNAWPATSAINSILYASSANTIANLAPVASSVLTTSSGGVPTYAGFTFNNSYNITVTFVTNGDLSVSYATRSGQWTQIGSLIVLKMTLNFTPTYTTASGRLNLSLPNTASVSLGGFLSSSPGTVFTYPAGTTYIAGFVTAGTATASLRGLGSATADANITTVHMPSGVAYSLTALFFYTI